MIGNSLKSDILPVLEIGGQAIHVPYHTMWEYEKIAQSSESQCVLMVESLREVLSLLV